MDTPVLFLVFNRPIQTARVFEAIRTQRPKHLFISSDGPRREKWAEAEIVRKTREIATQVDWPCEVRTLFRDTNLGCGAAVSGGITWFFEHVEEGIILEDDCVPHPDFFPYCEALLKRYRHENRIATIAGTNFLPPDLAHKGSHYVSKYFQMWGWATWRRVWSHYDFGLKCLTVDEWIALFRNTHPIAFEADYWREILFALKAGTDTWDFQVFFNCWRIQANHIMPARNLVSNIGYGPEATHTNFESMMAELPTFPLSIGPEEVSFVPDPKIDNIIFYLRFLESMTQTWWADQILAPRKKLSQARIELMNKNERIRILERELLLKRDQLIAATRALSKVTVKVSG